MGELVVIVIVALIVFGPNRLPEMMRSAGKAFRTFQAESQRAMAELRDAVDVADIGKDLNKVVMDEPDEMARKSEAAAASAAVAAASSKPKRAPAAKKKAAPAAKKKSTPAAKKKAAPAAKKKAAPAAKTKAAPTAEEQAAVVVATVGDYPGTEDT